MTLSHVQPVYEPIFNHVMIDIETMSLSPHNALILSIGMVEFDPDPAAAPGIGVHELIIPDIVEQIALGREISLSTQKFWNEQSDEARDHWVNPVQSRVSVNTAVARVAAFCSNASRVWAQGPQFDLVNLVQLARQSGRNADLWHYRAPRDARTFTSEVAPNPSRICVEKVSDERLVEHEPISDCTSQIYRVWQHWTPKQLSL